PVVANALRMRRFYVRPAFRRGGVGRQLVMALLADVRPGQLVTTNAAPTRGPLLESNGFEADPRGRATHILNRGRGWGGQLVAISSPASCRHSQPPASAPCCASSNPSPPIPATRPRGELVTGRPMNC